MSKTIHQSPIRRWVLSVKYAYDLLIEATSIFYHVFVGHKFIAILGKRRQIFDDLLFFFSLGQFSNGSTKSNEADDDLN